MAGSTSGLAAVDAGLIRNLGDREFDLALGQQVQARTQHRFADPLAPPRQNGKGWANFARSNAPTSAKAKRPRAVASERIRKPWYIPG